MLEIPQQTQTDRQADRQTYIVKERERERQTDRWIYIESVELSPWRKSNMQEVEQKKV